jgi:hypothetical protein
MKLSRKDIDERLDRILNRHNVEITVTRVDGEYYKVTHLASRKYDTIREVLAHLEGYLFALQGL